MALLSSPESVDHSIPSSVPPTSSPAMSSKEANDTSVSSSCQQVPPAKRKKTETDVDVVKSLREQTLSLNKISEIAHEKNLMIIYNYLPTSSCFHNENVGQLQKSNCQEQKKHCRNMKQQSKLLQGKIYQQGQKMHQMLENFKNDLEQQSGEAEAMEQKVMNIQQQLVENRRTREKELQQGTIQLEILDMLKKLTKQ